LLYCLLACLFALLLVCLLACLHAPSGRALLENLASSQLAQNFPHFKEPEIPLPHSQQPTSCPYPQPFLVECGVLCNLPYFTYPSFHNSDKMSTHMVTRFSCFNNIVYHFNQVKYCLYISLLRVIPNR
jgi:hypothetical protein